MQCVGVGVDVCGCVGVVQPIERRCWRIAAFGVPNAPLTSAAGGSMEARSADQVRRLRAFESNMHALESEALSALISEGDVARDQLEQIVDHMSSPARSSHSHSYVQESQQAKEE